MGDENKQLHIIQKEWKVKDVVISILIIISFGAIIGLVLPEKFLNEYLISHTIELIAIIVAILYLYFKYPFNIFTKIGITKFICYTAIGSICCLIINFPLAIWQGKTYLRPKEYQVFTDNSSYGQIYLIFLLCVSGPILEEILFRGFIYRILKNRYNIVIAAIISSLIYMLIHNLQIQILYLFLPSLIYAYVYEKTSSILSSIVTHSLNNTLWFLFTYWGLNR
ncbi:MAG TPA: type II CAAX endopeptidase family protein [Geobacteraceae bacterium]